MESPGGYIDFQLEVIFKILSDTNKIQIDKLKRNNIGERKDDVIDELLVNAVLSKKYMDYNSLDSMKSLFNIVFLHHLHNNGNNRNGETDELHIPFLDHSIVNVLNNIRLASTEKTAEGYALFSSFKSINDMVIIKTNRDGSRKWGILYEYFIGTMGINLLRKYVPNFAYTLGIFRCNPLVLTNKNSNPHLKNHTDSNKNRDVNIQMFCENKTIKDRYNENLESYYVMYEKISGESIESFVSKIETENDEKMLISYIIQIALALQIAQKQINFTHYDLHTENIILRKLPEIQVVEYHIDETTYRIETDAIPTIIDYGMSHFTMNGVPFGIEDHFRHLGIIPTITSQGHDMHKLLFYTLSSIFLNEYHTPKGKKLFDSISWIVYYFRDESGKKNDMYNICSKFETYLSMVSNDEKIRNRKTKQSLKKLNDAFEAGYNNYCSITEKFDIFQRPPIEFVKFVKQQKPDLYNEIVRETKNNSLTIDDISKRYSSLIQQKKIFGEEVTHSCETNFLEDQKSYILNNYTINELDSIIQKFKIKNSSLESKISELKQINKKHKKKYQKIDDMLIDEFNSILRKLSLNIYNQQYTNNYSFDTIKSIDEIKKWNNTMTNVESFVNIFNNFKILSDYSKFNTKCFIDGPLNQDNCFTNILIDEDLQEKYYQMQKDFLTFSRKKSEYMFNTLSTNLQELMLYIYDEENDSFITAYDWDMDETFYKCIRVSQYALEDIVLFYPWVEYACKSTINFLFRISSEVYYKINVCLYVSWLSEKQFQQLLTYDRERALNIVRKLLNDETKFEKITKKIDSIYKKKLGYIPGVDDPGFEDDLIIDTKNKENEKVSDDEVYLLISNHVSRDKVLENSRKNIIQQCTTLLKYKNLIREIPRKSPVYMNLSTNSKRDFFSSVINPSEKIEVNLNVSTKDCVELSVYTDNSIDFVTSFQLLSYFLDSNKIVREISRILKPGGFFLISEKDLTDELIQLTIDVEERLTNKISGSSTNQLFCKPKFLWDKMMIENGFNVVTFIESDMKISNPTNDFYALYQNDNKNRN